MTTKQYFAEFGKPILIVLIPTIIISSITTFVSIKTGLAVVINNIEHIEDEISEIKHHNDIYDNTIWELQKDCQYIKGTLGLQTIRGDKQ